MAVSRFAAARLRRIAAAIAFTLVVGGADAGVTLVQPNWADLSANEQRTLAPLAGEWDDLEAWRKKKWLDIAAKYPGMNADEQERIQRRMRAWAKLTPEERKAARETYRNVQKASNEEREALKKMWSEYQSLPPEQRQRFQQSAAGRPPAPESVAPNPSLAARPGSPAGIGTTHE